MKRTKIITMLFLAHEGNSPIRRILFGGFTARDVNATKVLLNRQCNQGIVLVIGSVVVAHDVESGIF